ncbi:SH3 domain-containing protein [Bradyrhizobium sp. LB11.1]|uniref:SH3 domain-containing protein n=1 Tax=Bradyrhizobium sp. LB11.1 TaxID=3156326 RepID=UPI00339887E4
MIDLSVFLLMVGGMAILFPLLQGTGAGMFSQLGNRFSNSYESNDKLSSPVVRQNAVIAPPPSVRDIAPIGWRVATANGRSAAVLSLPTHPDVKEISLSCDGSQMSLAITLWPNGRVVKKLGIGDDASSPEAEIDLALYSIDPLLGASATGDAVVQFYLHLNDVAEQLGPGSGVVGFISFRTRQSYAVDFRGFKSATQNALAQCVPKAATDKFAKPEITSGTTKDVLADRWEYAGRAATISTEPGDPVWSGSDGPFVYMVSFRCQDKPLFSISGAFVGELTGDKTPTGELSKEQALDFAVTTNEGKAINLKGSCGNGEGAPVCFMFPDNAQLNVMAGSAALTFAANGQRLLAVPFGSVDRVRKVFPHCGRGIQQEASLAPRANLPGEAATGAVKPAGQTQRVTPPPKVLAAPANGQTVVLESSLNVRASTSTSAPLVKSLTKGARIVVTNSEDREWSAVAVAGKGLGFVKNSALTLAQQPNRPTGGSVDQSPADRAAVPAANQQPARAQIAIAGKPTANSGLSNPMSIGAPGCETVWAPRLQRALQEREQARQSADDLKKYGLAGYELEPKERKCARVRLYLTSYAGIQDALHACPRLSTPDLAADADARQRFIGKGMSNQQCDQ